MKKKIQKKKRKKRDWTEWIKDKPMAGERKGMVKLAAAKENPRASVIRARKAVYWTLAMFSNNFRNKKMKEKGIGAI